MGSLIHWHGQSHARYFIVALLISVFIILFGVSTFIGAGDVTLRQLIDTSFHDEAWQLLVISRLPRTLALILAGASMAVAGMIMQMLMRNRFVEPSTAGTFESAVLGILVVTLISPELSVFTKMAVASVFSLAGTSLFLMILRRLPLRSPILVPIVGLVLGGVIHAVTVFIAYQYDLMQSVSSWMTGDFSGILRGRYELLWIGFIVACMAYIAADCFTVVGMGEQFTTNLGLNYRRLTMIGLIIVSVISAVVVVTVGIIPFLGLLVPNVASMFVGDNMRRTVPWVAFLGAMFVLLCDIIGRLIDYPHEIPIGTVVGVIGSGLFLFLLLNRRTRFV